MSNSKKTIGNVLDQSFNLESLDITYIEQVLSEIPKDGDLDPATASQLATKSLRAMDYCNTLLTRATKHLADKTAEVKRTKTEAVWRAMSAQNNESGLIVRKGLSPTVAKEVHGDDEKYQQALKEQGRATEIQGFLDRKYQDLIRLHILCKDIVKNTSAGKSSWDRMSGDSHEENESHDYPVVEGKKGHFGKTEWEDL